MSSLGDRELLELVVGPPTRTRRASASTIVQSSPNIAELSRATPRELARIVGAPRAARIAAAFELGRRALAVQFRRSSVGNAEDIFRIAAPRMIGLAQEIFLVVGVDIRNGLLDVVEVARGTAIGVEVHPREVFRPLVRMGAAGGVVVHNHPSGDPTPSAEDIELTRRLREAGQLLGIPIIDHVVVAQHGFRSIAEWLGSDIEAPLHGTAE
ncbi:MAG TPA: JAB domain-containing protein [Kofleriaceae bacterium]|nr:JAB domain-containing protein [Kofleriaceae bacterium]